MAIVCMYIVHAGVFYFSLGNLHPKYRSQYSSIHLVALCKRKFINLYSMTNMLRPLIEDVKSLVSLVVINYKVCNSYIVSTPYRRMATYSGLVTPRKQSMEPSVSSLPIIQQTIFLVALRRQMQHIACAVSAWPRP